MVCFCFDLGYDGLLLGILGFPVLLVVFTLVVVAGFGFVICDFVV